MNVRTFVAASVLMLAILVNSAHAQAEIEESKAFKAAEKRVAKEVKVNKEAKLLLEDAKKYEPGSLVPKVITPPPAPKPKIKTSAAMRQHHKKLTKEEQDRAIKIDCTGQTYYNAERRMITFKRNVVVKHPSFDLNTDILFVYLDDESGEVKEAIAQGWVEIFRDSPDGKPQIAHARHAKYIASSGDVILSIFPSVQEGTQIVEGTDEATKIYLPATGQYYTKGPTRMKMIHAKEKSKEPVRAKPVPTVSQNP